MGTQVKIIRTYKDKFEEDLMREVREDFRNYRYFDIGFGSILKSMIYDMNEQVLENESFREEIKYELKLIMSYLHMVRDKALIRDLKTSLFPLMLMGSGGNRTVLKQIILATHLSPKALPFITRTYRKIVEKKENLDPVRVAELYTRMLSNLRRVNRKLCRIQRLPEGEYKEKKLRQLVLYKERLKQGMRRRLGVPSMSMKLEDPYRSLKVVRISHHNPLEEESEYPLEIAG